MRGSAGSTAASGGGGCCGGGGGGDDGGGEDGGCRPAASATRTAVAPARQGIYGLQSRALSTRLVPSHDGVSGRNNGT